MVWDFALAGVVQFLAYLNLTVNFRAIALNKKWFAAATDGFATVFTFFIIKAVAGDDTYWTLGGMVVGGMCAAYVGIRMTEHWDVK
jgi:hypothetical protein